MFVITSNSSNSPAIRLNSFFATESNHVGGFTLSFLLVTVFRLLIVAQFHLLSIDLYYLLINANESVSLSFLCEPPPSAEPLYGIKRTFARKARRRSPGRHYLLLWWGCLSFFLSNYFLFFFSSSFVFLL